jgi:hypothetical protein
MRLFYEIFSKMVYFVLKFTERVIFVDSAAGTGGNLAQQVK